MILLDTHVLIWWIGGEDRLMSAAARAAIAAELQTGTILVSSITAWEIAQLVSRGRLALAMDVTAWLATVSAINRVRFVPIDNEIAVKSVELPGVFHKDPADRMIVATARRFAVPLLTVDEKILAYEHVHAVNVAAPGR